MGPNIWNREPEMSLSQGLQKPMGLFQLPENLRKYTFCHSVHSLTPWYLVTGLPWLSEALQDQVCLDIDGHPKQEEEVADHKSWIIEPGGVVAGKVGEVASLHVPIEQAEQAAHQIDDEWSRAAVHQCTVQEDPVHRGNVPIETYKVMATLYICTVLEKCYMPQTFFWPRRKDIPYHHHLGCS